MKDSQSLGWNVWRPEALQAGVLRLHKEKKKKVSPNLILFRSSREITANNNCS